MTMNNDERHELAYKIAEAFIDSNLESMHGETIYYLYRHVKDVVGLDNVDSSWKETYRGSPDEDMFSIVQTWLYDAVTQAANRMLADAEL